MKYVYMSIVNAIVIFIICCEPIKCLNYNICKFMCLDEYQMCEFPFCVECDCDMGKFKNTNIIKECNICYENKNIVLLDCNHEICSECLKLISINNIEKNYDECLLCPFCRNNNAN